MGGKKRGIQHNASPPLQPAERHSASASHNCSRARITNAQTQTEQTHKHNCSILAHRLFNPEMRLSLQHCQSIYYGGTIFDMNESAAVPYIENRSCNPEGIHPSVSQRKILLQYSGTCATHHPSIQHTMPCMLSRFFLHDICRCCGASRLLRCRV